MKLNMKWATLVLILLLTYITWRQSRREGACAAATALTEQAIKKACDELGGEVRDSKCVCPEGAPAQ